MLAAGWLPIRAVAQSSAKPDAQLRKEFADPPATAKLRCYWWWLNGNTTEETITRDLTEMSGKGFGGVLLVDGNGSNQHGNEDVPAGPRFGSPEWVRLYVHALKVASQLHLELNLNIVSGWNLGGPDVTPEQASKLLTWSRTTVGAGSSFNGALPMPPIKNGFYREIAVLAYPLRHGASLPGSEGDTRAPIRLLKYKTASLETGISMPKSEPLLNDAPPTPGEQDTELGNVINVTGLVDQAGRLTWHPPSAGTWEILRIGYTDSDTRVSTSSDTWQGLAIDYLDRGAFDTYWDHTVAPLLEASRPYLKTTLVNLATDSWEVGGTNWTGRFAAEFRERRGYDPIGYLPIVAGRIVDDRATSDRFLNDLRRTVGDLITDHYDHFAERAREYGLGLQCESGGPHGAPVDGLETFRSSAMPQTEFWAESAEHRSGDEDRFFIKEAASAADIYGKPFAADEGMTSIGPHWSESLATDLKPTFDRALTEGMNRLVWHEFTSEPKAFGLPGIEYFAGTHINPNVTWWNQSEPFFRYLNRSQLMLQQGHAVDDVLYFYGDEVPNFARLKRDDPAHVLPGYDYDVTDEDALLHTLTLHRGALASPGGNAYRLLVMPSGRRLSLASLKRIADYVRQGGALAGEPPLGPTGNVDEVAARQFSQLVRDLWGGCRTKRRTYGSGTVFCTAEGKAALRTMQVVPDFEDTAGKLDYVHRSDGARHIFFVRNGSGRDVDTVAKFRVTGRAPDLWDAQDGSTTPAMVYREEHGRTEVPLHLAPYGSIFVVFERAAGVHAIQVVKDGREVPTAAVSGDEQTGFALEGAAAGAYRVRLSDGRELTARVASPTSRDLPAGQWTIEFQPDRGAPIGERPLSSFQSWTKSDDPGVRYFSGTATYRTELGIHPNAGEQVILALSDLHEICTVRVNGKDAGTLWAMPYRLDITAALAPGRNTIELEVTNLWPNRIIGDAQPFARRTYTQTNIRKYTAASPLLPSGLIGPVTLETVHDTKLRLALDPRGKP